MGCWCKTKLTLSYCLQESIWVRHEGVQWWLVKITKSVTSFDRYHLSISIEALIISQIIQNFIFFVNLSSIIWFLQIAMRCSWRDKRKVESTPSRQMVNKNSMFIVIRGLMEVDGLSSKRDLMAQSTFSKTGRATRMDLVTWKMNSGLDLTKFIA